MKWCADEFSLIFTQIFASTSDKELHELAINLAAEHIEELLEHPVFLAAEVIDEKGLAIITKLNDVIRYVQKRNKELEAVATSLSTALETSKADHILTKSAIQAILQELKRRSECRNMSCSAQFTCHIDMEFDGAFTLRCDICKCKHR